MICGGIDLGGTKIEARLFDGPAVQTMDTKRVPTPKDSYPALLDALSRQIDWLAERSGRSDLPIGIAVPGVIDPQSGALFAANLVESGRGLGADVSARFARAFPMMNDCMAFTLSEADGGAGDGYEAVVGLVLGTGVGAGFYSGASMAPRHGGIAVEIGHVAAPASAVMRHNLKLLPCGCGREGCYETIISGTGLANLAETLTGTRIRAECLTSETHQPIMDIWADIAGECLVSLQLTLAPDCIVLGGGVSQMPGIVGILTQSMARHMVPGIPLPHIAVARHGDSSGARGAALNALAQSQ